MTNFDQNRKYNFGENETHFSHHVSFKIKTVSLRVDVLRGSLALCVWKVAKTIITIPITLRVGLVTWKNINSCIRWYYHLKNSQNVTFNEFSNIFSLPKVKMGPWRTFYHIERTSRYVWNWPCTIWYIQTGQFYFRNWSFLIKNDFFWPLIHQKWGLYFYSIFLFSFETRHCDKNASFYQNKIIRFFFWPENWESNLEYFSPHRNSDKNAVSGHYWYYIISQKRFIQPFLWFMIVCYLIIVCLFQ